MSSIRPAAYSDKDLEPLRKQVSEASGWSRVVNVKEKDENTEIFRVDPGRQDQQLPGCDRRGKGTERRAHRGHTDAGAG